MIPWLAGIRKLIGSHTVAVDLSDGERFRLLAESSADVICQLGPDHRISYISPSALSVFGRPPEDLIGLEPDALIVKEDMPIIAAAAARFARGESETATTQVRIVAPEGRLLWVETHARRLPAANKAEGFETVLVMRDITDRKVLEEQLTSLALQDGLTGLANRRAFDQALEREWERTVSEGSQMGLLLLDVDHFKLFNDQYGHQVGDDCLRAVGAAVKGCVLRPSDLAARYGGEEIVVVLPGCDAEGAIAIAEQIRLAVEALGIPHAGNDGVSCVTVSLGVATALARSGGTMRMPEGLLQAADAALYRAKSKGRNRTESTLLFAPAVQQ